MAESPLQTSLFEEDYLLRELGQVAHVPQIALTELVANAWDAGASRVALTLPVEEGDTLVVTDNGHGMTPREFKQRWMTLGYDRVKHQGPNVEFPEGTRARARRAFGRNGVGRHGLLCFADHYEVQSWRDGVLGTFVVSTGSGNSPFVLRSQQFGERDKSGTRLSVCVSRKVPDADEILTVLAARFVHDPEFVVTVNGERRTFDQLEGRISEERLDMGDGRSATVYVIDSSQVNHSSLHQGIAFWVQDRLVGTPSWSLSDVGSFDGRTRFARRYKVIVDTEGYENDVKKDWTGFLSTESVNDLFRATIEHIEKVAQGLAAEVVDAASEDALSQNRSDLEGLGDGARLDVASFTKSVAEEHPTVAPEFLSTAVKAVISLEKTKSGAALLQRLTSLSSDDVEGLDRLLSEWTVKDALRALDEIGNRLSVVETIRRLSDDPDADELHTLHPLILRSRWIFGAEFESQEYCSNATLKTVSKELFKSRDAEFINDRRRPDIVALPDKTTWQMTGVESFDQADPGLTRMERVLVVELKRGGFKITRDEVYQADGYVQDIHASGAMAATPYICAWVVGQTIGAGVESDKKLGDPQYGRVRATTFGALVDTANARLMKLRDVLAERYEGVSTNELLDRVFSHPKQENMRFENTHTDIAPAASRSANS